MPITNQDFIDGLISSRKYLLKHLRDVTPEQTVFKPYAECKSIIETLKHLIIDDRMALYSFQTEQEPPYDSVNVAESSYEDLLAALATSHQELIDWMTANLASEPLDKPACAWGSMLPAAKAISMMSSEDFYHAGQIAFVRMAVDPSWDYYSAIYGAE